MDDASFIKTVEGLLKSCKLGVRPNEQEVLSDNKEYEFDGEQSDLYRLHRKLLRYAETQAKGLSSAAPADAVNKVFDKAASGKSIDSWYHAKTIIDNHLKDLRRKQGRGKEPVTLEIGAWDIKHFVDVYSGDFNEDTGDYTEKENPTWGWHGFRLPNRHGYPGMNVYRMHNDTEGEICKLYWEYDMEQKEIAEKLGKDKGYISRIIKRNRASPKPDTRDRFTSGIYPQETPASPVVYKPLPPNKKFNKKDTP